LDGRASHSDLEDQPALLERIVEFWGLRMTGLVDKFREELWDFFRVSSLSPFYSAGRSLSPSLRARPGELVSFGFVLLVVALLMNYYLAKESGKFDDTWQYLIRLLFQTFYVGAFFVFIEVFLNQRYKKTIEKNRLLNKGCPARTDYIWDPEKSRFDRGKIVVVGFFRLMLITAAVSVFFVPFILRLESGRPFSAFPLFCLAALCLFVVYEFFRFLILASSYLLSSQTELLWGKFPIIRGELCELIFEIKKSGSDDLCVHGKVMLNEELDNQRQGESYIIGAVKRATIWKSKVNFKNTAHGHYVARFSVPQELPATNISGAGRIFFWELEVIVVCKKHVWKELHLLPIY
jgi:hypothetical protein